MKKGLTAICIICLFPMAGKCILSNQISQIRKIRPYVQSNYVLMQSAITNLLETCTEKIENDINLTATAFADAYNIQKNLKWADIFGFGLNTITAVLSTVSNLLTFSDPSNLLSEAFLKYQLPIQVLSGFLTLDSVFQSSNRLKTAIEGSEYSDEIKNMLDDAYNESSTKLFFNYSAYQTSIKNRLLGLYGNTPLRIGHRSSKESREIIEVAQGGDRVLKAIRTRLRAIRDKIEKSSIRSDKDFEIINKIDEVRKLLSKSRISKTEIEYETYIEGHKFPSKAKVVIGNIAVLETQRLDAYTNLDKSLEREEILTLSKALSGTLNVIKIEFVITGSQEITQTIGSITQLMILPTGIDFSEKILKSSVHKTNPREQINLIPQQMLLSLSKEISDLWMIVDDIANYIEKEI